MNKLEIKKQKLERFGEEKLNKQKSPMKIVEYNSATDIVVKFQDNYGFEVRTCYDSFRSGSIRNPYHPSIYNVGIVGDGYKTCLNYKHTKEYQVWTDMLKRCYSEKFKKKWYTYQDVTCCEEWLLFENFYEWLHKQENFDKWLNDEKWELDKDILIKGNKVYSPNSCCLVPNNINSLFLKRNADRGSYPIGVSICKNGFQSRCKNPLTKKDEYLGSYKTIEEAFQAYKKRKEEDRKSVV